MRILLVADNRQVSAWLAKSLRRERYAVDCVYCGEDAKHVLATEEYGLVILELTATAGKGLEFLRELRTRGSSVPVIILTADDSIESRIIGLNAGADDYLAKPFNFAELEARIRVQLRRANSHKNPIVECGALAFDSNTLQFTLAGQPLALTPREHSVLETLIFRAGATVRKTALAMSVFGFEDEAHPNAIEVYVHRVRRKLEGSDVGIVTRRGLGYSLTRKRPAYSALRPPALDAPLLRPEAPAYCSSCREALEPVPV